MKLQSKLGHTKVVSLPVVVPSQGLHCVYVVSN